MGTLYHKQITGQDWDWSIEGLTKREPRLKYMLLSRMQMDCDYYLGFGMRRASILWAGNEQLQIEYMKALWNSLEEKPEWLTMEQIEEYEKQMTN